VVCEVPSFSEFRLIARTECLGYESLLTPKQEQNATNTAQEGSG
jgi:hypothetical protein